MILQLLVWNLLLAMEMDTRVPSSCQSILHLRRGTLLLSRNWKRFCWTQNYPCLSAIVPCLHFEILEPKKLFWLWQLDLMWVFLARFVSHLKRPNNRTLARCSGTKLVTFLVSFNILRLLGLWLKFWSVITSMQWCVMKLLSLLDQLRLMMSWRCSKSNEKVPRMQISHRFFFFLQIFCWQRACRCSKLHCCIGHVRARAKRGVPICRHSVKRKIKNSHF